MSIFSLMPYRQADIANYFDDIEKRFFRGVGELSGFNTDVLDKGDSYVLQAELPGFKKEDIGISLDGECLTVTATRTEEKESGEQGKYLRRERRYGSYKRTFDVSGVDVERISAKYESGVLELTLPKHTPALPETRTIAIQ